MTLPPSRLKGLEKEPKATINGNITISATSKLAGQIVAPFLAKHIPDQYAPSGGMDSSGSPKVKDSNTKYCYRHRPDLKCRRQANEPSMDQLQHELEVLSHADQQAVAHVWSLFSAAPSKQRNLMLQGILTQCCFPQLSYLSDNVRELIRIDFLSALPCELSFRVLCFLDTTSLCKAAQVSRNWRMLADDDVVWHRMCEQHIDRKCTKCGWGLPLLERKRLRASKRQIQLRATGQGLNEWSPNITPLPELGDESRQGDQEVDEGASGPLTTSRNEVKRPFPSTEQTDMDDSYFLPRVQAWKDVYKDRFKVGINWKYGRYSMKIFKGHSNGVMCLQFDENILATGSYDTTIKIWDIHSGEELRTLRGHSSGVRALQFDDTKLISGSLDCTLKIWNWATGECIKTYAQPDGIIGLHFDSAILAAGSRDGTVKVWEFQDKSTFVLRGHTDWVNAVKVDCVSRTLFSASDDGTDTLAKSSRSSLCPRIRIRTKRPRRSRRRVVDIKQQFPELHHRARSRLPTSDSFGPGFSDSTRRLPPRYILTGALDSTIRLWDTTTTKCLRTYFGHVEGIWALAADTLRFISGAEDRMTKVWDPRTGKCERTFAGHAGPVTCVGLSDSRFCTAGEDCEVRMYSF
ncbi:E3 ubiquitin ligase complex SCF subunit sconB [Physcia stellaris]|nr:E3 ubiquitin ligase complex SCF subunit sconB [Physcia stellaris]